MPSLADERRALLLADLHLMEAKRRISRLEQMLPPTTAPEADAAADALAALKDGLAAMEQHRRIIQDLIGDLEAGRLRDPGLLGRW